MSSKRRALQSITRDVQRREDRRKISKNSSLKSSIESKTQKSKSKIAFGDSNLFVDSSEDDHNDESDDPAVVIHSHSTKGGQGDGDGSDESEETAEDKRLRLSKEFIADIQRQIREEREAVGADSSDSEGSESSEGNMEEVAQRIREVNAKAKHRHQYVLAGSLIACGMPSITELRGPQSPPTCCALVGDTGSAVGGTREGEVIVWDMDTGKRVWTLKAKYKNDMRRSNGHLGSVLAVAVTGDHKYMATAGDDRCIKIWKFDGGKLLSPSSATSSSQSPPFHLFHTFESAHSAPITSLCFRRDSHELYSGSKDRRVKMWMIDEKMAMDTFGHVDEVMSVDCLHKQRPISGGMDRSVRMWKIVEEKQLLYQGVTSSIDSVSYIADDKFIGGCQDGCVYMWLANKKFPFYTIDSAHNGNWVSAVAAVPYADIMASGSSDGFVNIYKMETLGPNTNKLKRILQVPVAGIVNALQWSSDGRTLIAAVGKENKHGRWHKAAEARNSVVVMRWEGVREGTVKEVAIPLPEIGGTTLKTGCKRKESGMDSVEREGAKKKKFDLLFEVEEDDEFGGHKSKNGISNSSSNGGEGRPYRGRGRGGGRTIGRGGGRGRGRGRGRGGRGR